MYRYTCYVTHNAHCRQALNIFFYFNKSSTNSEKCVFKYGNKTEFSFKIAQQLLEKKLYKWNDFNEEDIL